MGDRIIGGSILKEGLLHFKVTVTSDKSILKQIIALVERAQMKKAPMQQSTDRIAGIFAIAVSIFSSFVFIVWFVLLQYGFVRMDSIPNPLHPASLSSPFTVAFSFAISTLVVSCPCAMGLATPTAIMYFTSIFS